jgi:RimJ/RimL family protein N-acetyltransferase
MKGNIASIKVLEKMGMTFKDTLPLMNTRD